MRGQTFMTHLLFVGANVSVVTVMVDVCWGSTHQCIYILWWRTGLKQHCDIVEGLQGEIHTATMYQPCWPSAGNSARSDSKMTENDGWFSYRDSFSFILTNYFIHTAVILSSSVSFASWTFFLLLTSHFLYLTLLSASFHTLSFHRTCKRPLPPTSRGTW